MVRKVTLSVKIQAKVNFEGMGAKPLNGRYVGFGYRKTSKGANMQRMANCRR
ncbi:hypothetical protein CZ797_16080 [Pseudoalteromonas sp. JB197]|nr:hypothetical protein CZ797_16080 [Pseudoalteromonas sp. JB197]